MLIQKYFFYVCKQAKERYNIKYLNLWENNFIQIKPRQICTFRIK